MPSPPARLVAPILLLALAAAPPARADTFVLKDGREIDGYRAGVTPRRELVIGTDQGTRKTFESLVVEVRPSVDPAADFRRYFEGLGKRDADAAYHLGVWARERELGEEVARKALEKAIAVKPDHAGAREALGYKRVGKEWLTEAQVERRRKDEEFRGQLAARYRELAGSAPEIVLTDHWAYLDWLGDRKTEERAAQMEDAYREAVRVFGSDPWPERGLVLTFGSQEDYLRWVEKEASKLVGVTPQLLDFYRKATGMKWTEPAILARFNAPDSGAMHAANVHASGHLLLGRWAGVNRAIPFWMEEGFGGWMEDTILTTTSSYCFAVSKAGYGSTFRDAEMWEVEFPDWKALAKEAVRKNGFLPLDQLDMLPRGEYGRREVGQAFSLVAFLVREKGPEKFRDYVRKVKSGTRSPKALEEVYGTGFEGLESEWKGFVAGW